MLTVVNSETDLDFARLRILAHSPEGEPWHHSSDLFFAVHAGKTEYSVVDSVKDTHEWDFSSYDDLKNRALYETKTDYKLLDRVVSLDAQHAQAVQDISPEHFQHCVEEQSHTLQEGDFVIGSSHGAWFKSKSVQSRLASAGLLAAHKDDASKHSIALVRRVVSTELAADGCRKVITESLHPLEIFESMKIESSGVRPFHDVSVPLATPTEERERELQNNVVNPDAPLVTCPKYAFTAGKQFTKGTAGGVSYNLGTQGGCLQYNYNIGSITMNYNWNTRGSQQTILLSTGLTCKDCYLYTGAGFLVIAQYQTGSSFRAEVKVGGGAGFNLNMIATNPSIRGSQVINVLGAGSWSTINLGPGLAFSYSMGGVRADVSGSGSATGSGSAVAGAQAQASMGFAYSGGKTWTPTTAFSTWTKPSVSMKFTSFKPTSAEVLLTGRLNAQIVLGSGVGKLTGHVDITAQSRIDYKMSSMTSLSARIAEDEAFAARRALGSSDVEGQTFAPGSEVPIDTSYKGLVPEEEHVLFFSLMTPEGQEIPIHEGRFITSKSGTGRHRSAWRVPSDSRFSHGGHRIMVRCSNLYSRAVSTQPFSFSDFVNNGGAVSSPTSGDRVVGGDEQPINIRWDTTNMHRFKRDGPMHGKHMKTRRVMFELHGEKLDKSGAVVQQASTRKLVPEPVDNTGEASIVIPASFANRFERFFVEVHDADADEVSGSNTGYFYRKASPAVSRSGAARVPRVDRRNRGEVAGGGKALRLRGGGDALAVQEEQESARALAACKSDFTFGFGVLASGGLDSMSILLWSVPIGQDLPFQWLLPVKVMCV